MVVMYKTSQYHDYCVIPGVFDCVLKEHLACLVFTPHILLDGSISLIYKYIHTTILHELGTKVLNARASHAIL